jgi:DNA-binding MarR family transcriptional regulator
MTRAEARLLVAWQRLRADNPWQQPSVAELAEVLEERHDVVLEVLARLEERGLLRRRTTLERARPYQMTVDAAARPFMRDAVRALVAVARIDLDALRRGEQWEEFEHAWGECIVVARAVAALAREHQRASAATVRAHRAKQRRREEGDRGPA